MKGTEKRPRVLLAHRALSWWDARPFPDTTGPAVPDDTSPDLASPARLLALTAGIVSAQVRGNKVGAAELPGLVQVVHQALADLTRDPAETEPPRPEPAVPVRRSVRPDAITCLACGRRFKAIKRHLAAEHGLTPEEYRARWGLPADYPLVAPDYADTRSNLAKQAGLGRKRTSNAGTTAPVPVPATDPMPEAEATPDPAPGVATPPDEEATPPPPKRRGRRKTTAGQAPG